MSIRKLFAEYRSKVANPDNYPFAPLWVKEWLLEQIDALIALENEQEFEGKARYFDIGATRYIAGECGAECDELLADIPGTEMPEWPKESSER